MPTYNTQIQRTDIEASPEFNAQVIKEVTESSATLRISTRLRDMTRQQYRMPVVSALPTAYFVNGDTGLKQTTQMSWADVYITAEEIAAIVPVPEAVLADAEYDIWGEVRPALVEAFGRAIDGAVLYSTNKPSTWPVGLVPGATAAGLVASLAAHIDLYDATLGETGHIALLEAAGYIPTGHLGAISMRSKLRATRDADGQPIFRASANPQAGWAYELDGLPLDFPRNGAFDAAQSLIVSGDWKRLVYSMRQDITYKVLDQAVIQDGGGAIQFNLAQQDMVALRAVMRLGWALPNPVNRVQPVEANRYQFAILTA